MTNKTISKIEIVKNVVSLLNEDEKQLLKDVIIEGVWGDSTEEFLNDDGKKEEYMMFAYCTNDAKNAGHFSGKKVSSMFRSIFNKLCDENGTGRYISHCSDWWGDGKGDMLFIREDVYEEFEKWASDHTSK